MAITVAGRTVLHGTIRFTLSGLWSGYFELQEGEDLDGAALLDLEGTQLQGSVRTSTVYGERTGVEIVAGADGLGTTMRAQQYRDSPLSLPLGDIVRQAGETLASGIDSSITSRLLHHWTVQAKSAGKALYDLVEHVQTSWWALDDGSIFLGSPDWEVVEPEHQLTDTLLELREYEIAPTDYSLRPGKTFLGQRISRVKYTIQPSSLRALVEITQ